MTTLRPSELAYQRTVLEAARLGGWLCHAERAAMNRAGRYSTPIQGDKGWPDLILARGPRLLAIELKRRPNKPTAAQVVWLDALKAAGVDARLVFVPDELDALCAELVRHE